MKLTPLVNGTELAPATVQIQANKDWVLAVNQKVERVLPLAENITAETLGAAVAGTREMQAVIKEIDAEEKLANAKIKPSLEAIKEVARQVRAKPKAAYDLLTARLGQYYEKEQARKAAEEIARLTAQREAEAKARVEAEERDRARQELVAAELAAKTLEDQKRAAAEREDFELGLALANAFPDPEPAPAPLELAAEPKIPGARVTRRYKYTLVDPIAVYNYSKQLLRIELKHAVCEDVRRMLEERGLPLTIPGVEISTYDDVSVTGAAQISYE